MNPLRQVIKKDGKMWLVVQLPEKPTNDGLFDIELYEGLLVHWQAECTRLTTQYPPILCEGFKEGDRDLLFGRDYALDACCANSCDGFKCESGNVHASALPILKEEEGEKEQSQWIAVSDRLPDAKPDWGHSEQCLVWYEGEPNVNVENYGIAYYNYEPPFEQKGMWVDFHHYGRQPSFWQPLPPPPKATTTS